jgi:hypothetical protein
VKGLIYGLVAGYGVGVVTTGIVIVQEVLSRPSEQRSYRPRAILGLVGASLLWPTMYHDLMREELRPNVVIVNGRAVEVPR